MRVGVNTAMESSAKSVSSRAVIIQKLPPMEKQVQIKSKNYSIVIAE